MPVMDDLAQLLEAGRLRSARVIVVHPDDFQELALGLSHEPSFDISHRDEVTAFGVRLVTSRYQQQGHVSVITEPEGWIGTSNGAPLDFLRTPALEAFGLGGAGLVRSGGAGRDGLMVIEEWPEEPPPAPKTLWEILESDDD